MSNIVVDQLQSLSEPSKTVSMSEVVDYKTRLFDLLRKQAAEAGLTLVDGSFETGATVSLKTHVIWQQATGKIFGWFQDAVKTVGAGSSPASTGGVGSGAWVDRSDVTLRSDLNVVVKVFKSVADMKADATLSVWQKCRTLGYYAVGDGGGNDYEIVAAATGTDDGGRYINLPSSGFQAKGLFGNVVNVKQFGAKGDGITDDTLSIQSAIDSGITTHGKEIRLLDGTYILSSPLMFGGEGVTLRGSSNLLGGSSKIKTLAQYLLKTRAGSGGKAFNIYNTSFEGVRLTTDLIDQSGGGDWRWSTIQGCYFVNFRNANILNTGLHILNNNFQNFRSIVLRGGDFSFNTNYANCDSTDSTIGASESFLTLSATTGVDFSGNYISSKFVPGKNPSSLSVYNSSSIRVLSNWLDGGTMHSLRVEAGSHSCVISSNRILYDDGNIPILISNIRGVNIVNNLVNSLPESAPYIRFESILKRCVLRDNICNTFNDESTHGIVVTQSSVQDVKIDEVNLKVIHITTGGAYIWPFWAGATFTNYGNVTATQFFYIYPRSMKAGQEIRFNRIVTTTRLILVSPVESINYYDSNSASFNRFRLICYVDGVATIESME